MPFPTSVRGDSAVVDLMVDEYGAPIKKSITVAILRDRVYASRIVMVTRDFEFHPASLNGCAVSAPYQFVLNFAR